MKRLFKRYRKLLNRFFVSVVVSVCLINTVSLDAQAAVASHTDVDILGSITYYHETDYHVTGLAYFDNSYWGSGKFFTISSYEGHVHISFNVDLLDPIPAHKVFTPYISMYLTNTGYAVVSDFSCSVPGLNAYWEFGADPWRNHYFEIRGTASTGENVLTNFTCELDLIFNSSEDERLYFTSHSGGIEYWDDESASIGSTIKDNTDKLVQGQGETNNKLDNITNGYDSSSGDTASGKLDGSVSDFEQAEGSIFDSAQGHLKDFEFFDFNSIPAVVTGLSFVTSSMTAVFDAMGGLSGAGIVLSVLFAVMFLSIVIGLYRYFK